MYRRLVSRAITSLIGQPGWADGRAGFANQSAIRFNDYRLIRDLAELPDDELYPKLNSMGDKSAAYLRQIVPLALKHATNLIIATRVPLYVEAGTF